MISIGGVGGIVQSMPSFAVEVSIQTLAPVTVDVVASPGESWVLLGRDVLKSPLDHAKQRSWCVLPKADDENGIFLPNPLFFAIITFVARDELPAGFMRGCTMGAILDLRTEVIHRYVFELRYELGQVYWDRAGRIAKSIISTFQGWDFDAIDLNRCQVSDRESNLAFNFGPEKLDLSQTQSASLSKLMPLGEFGKVGEALTKIVVETLQLELFPRIGFRVWHLYPTNTREESYALFHNLKLFRPDSGSLQALGAATGFSHRLVVDRGTNMVRLAVAAFEQQVDLAPSLIRTAKAKAHVNVKDRRLQSIGQYKANLEHLKARKAIESFPRFGLLLDMDAYLEDPPYPDALSISNFVAAANDDFVKMKSLVLESTT